MAADYNLFGMSDSQRSRIDNWLKHVCLFKHRAEATDACRGGRVKVNGQRVKPAAPVHEEDVIEFYAGETFRRVIVKSVPDTQQPKELARTMYVDETPVVQKIDTVNRDRGTGRPTKRERRELEDFHRGNRR
jgi:ribosome-associated heat shock protein Hsp15